MVVQDTSAEENKGHSQEDAGQQAKTDLLTETVLEERKDESDNRDSDETQMTRHLRTLPLYMTCFGLGMYQALIGPSFPDFSWNTGASVDRIVMIVVLLSVGYIVASLIGGICYDTFNSNLLMALSVTFSSVAVVSLSLCPSLPLLLTASVCVGIADGFIDIGLFTICVKIWKKDCAVVLQALSFSFAIGATISPLFSAPFLMEMPYNNNNGSNVTSEMTLSVNPPLNDGNLSLIWKSNETVEQYHPIDNVDNFTEFPARDNTLEQSDANTLNGSSDSFTNQATSDTEFKINAGRQASSKLWIPYTIVSCFMIILSIPFYIPFCKNGCTLKIPKISKTEGKDVNDRSKDGVFYTISIVSFLCLFSALAASAFALYGTFIYTYAINMNLGFTPNTASFLTSLFWGCSAAAQGISIFMAKCLSPKTMIIMDLVGMVFTTVLLAAFGRTMPEVLWVVSCLFGISATSLFGCGIAWAGQHITLTGKVTSVTLLGPAVALSFLPPVQGKLFAIYGYSSFAFMMVAICGLNAAVYIIMQTIASAHGRRHARHRNENIELPPIEDEASI
ncbi:sodium-dependent glucose transporter 1A-like isoform X2 [Ptychodera flava]